MPASTAPTQRRQADQLTASRASEAYGDMTLQAIIDEDDEQP